MILQNLLNRARELSNQGLFQDIFIPCFSNMFLQCFTLGLIVPGVNNQYYWGYTKIIDTKKESRMYVIDVFNLGPWHGLVVMDFKIPWS